MLGGDDMSFKGKRIRSFLAILLSILMVLSLPGPRMVRAEDDPSSIIQEGSALITVDNAAYGEYWTAKKEKIGWSWKVVDVDRYELVLPWFYKEGVGNYGDFRDAYVAGNSVDAPDPQLPDDDVGPVVPWERTSMSNIGFTVKGTGTFFFEYRAELHKANIGKDVNGNSYRHQIAAKINAPLSWFNVNTSDWHSEESQTGPNTSSGGTYFPGWLDTTIEINEEHLDDDGEATIYIAYVRANADFYADENFGAIANVAFYPDDAPITDYNLTLNIEGHTYGKVSVGGTSYSGSNQVIPCTPNAHISLTANAYEGGQFFGWKDENGELIKTEEDLSFTITGDRSVTAVFVPEGYFVARRNEDHYYSAGDGGLVQALQDASAGDYVLLLEDTILTSDVTVPSGVSLHVPFRDEFAAGNWSYVSGGQTYRGNDREGYVDGNSDKNHPYGASAKIASEDKVFRSLTINEGVTLTVKGSVVVGSVISYPSQQYQGHTSGRHGKIVNNGSILIKNNGKLDSWGFITGDGTVTAESGGKVYEPFMVLDYCGGSNSEQLFNNHQSPFKQYAMQNIQTELVILPGATLMAHCNLYALSIYNKTDVVYVGTNGLFEPAVGATFIRTFDANKTTTRDPGVGVMTYTFDGGMNVKVMGLDIWGILISTEDVDFPIPQSINLVLKKGDYDAGRTKLMPGSSMRVEEDAHLEVTKTLYVLDGLMESAMGGERKYHSTGALQDKGFDGSALLYVEGSMTVRDGARFGGVVQTGNGSTSSTMTFESSAILDNALVLDGARGWYETNISRFALPARAYLYNRDTKTYALTDLVAGETYTHYDDTEWQMQNYSMDYAVKCTEEESVPDLRPLVSTTYVDDPEEEAKVPHYKWSGMTTVTLNESRTGSWAMPFNGYAVNVTKGTTSNPSDDSKATVNVDDEIDEGQDLVFTVTSTEAGTGYVHLVTYTMGSGDPVVLSPENGFYTIGNVQGNISIQVESRRYGDLVVSDTIDIFDLIAMRQIVASGFLNMDPMTALVTDFNQDGKWNVFDLIAMRNHIASGLN